VSVFCRHNRYTADCPICSKGTVLERGRKPARRAAGGGGARREKSAPATPVGFSGKYVSAGPYHDEDDATYEVRLERVPGGIRLAEWDGSGLRRRAPVLLAEDVARLVHAAAGVLDARDATRLAAALPPAAPAEDFAERNRGEERSEPVSAGETAAADAATPAAPATAEVPTPAEPTTAAAEATTAAEAMTAAEAPTDATGAEAAATAETATGVSRGRSGDFKEELRVEGLAEGRLRVGRWVLRPGSGWQLQEAPPMLPAARYAEALADAAAHGLVPAASDAGDAARL
jgi:hypothetical protein